MLGSMRGDSKRPQLAISYPDADDSRNGNVSRWAGFGWLATIALLLVGVVAGYLWNQQEASPVTDFQCDKVRALAQDTEQAAVSTLARRNSLQNELDELLQFFTRADIFFNRADIDRSNELRSEIPSQESRVLFGYSGWEDALNSDRDCFGTADLIFAESRIKMVRVLFE